MERRDQVVDDGVELLAEALADLRRLLTEGAEDDVAVDAVRLRPQQR